uniref:Uncharacterized protein n=1 Tax=Plectus sambesii TaxID=2011161 RepID=A0A914WLI1_9BILA
MSVSHPFLKQLKFHVLELCQHDGEIGDSNPKLQPFCKALEDILCDGLKGSGSTKTDVGQGRLVIRCCLNRGLLSKCVRLLRADRSLLLTYYEEDSIIGDEIMSELFVSLLIPLETSAKFILNLRACSFLDETWELPCMRRYELVPCEKIGLNILAVLGRLIVTEVESGSVADEDMKIEPGDILDDLFGESLREATVGKTVRLLNDFKGAPIYLSVVKCLYPNGSFYRASFPYLDAAELDKSTILAWREKRQQEIRGLNKEFCFEPESQGENDVTEAVEENSEQTQSGLYKCKVLGYVNVGSVGTVEYIESGVNSVVQNCPEHEKQDVLVELGETDVTIYNAKDPDVILLQHSYPEISSCGRRTDYPLNFSYIAGNTSCNYARTFFCYVFEAKSGEQAKTILKTIADGFDRTHWAV